MLDKLLTMLDQGQDGAMLRFSLGNEYLKRERPQDAADHLGEAVAQDPDYSAAWKLYGQALDAAGQTEQALDAFERGIAAAEKRGDKQAAKEMNVFLRRLRKQQQAATGDGAGE